MQLLIQLIQPSSFANVCGCLELWVANKSLRFQQTKLDEIHSKINGQKATRKTIKKKIWQESIDKCRISPEALLQCHELQPGRQHGNKGSWSFINVFENVRSKYNTKITKAPGTPFLDTRWYKNQWRQVSWALHLNRKMLRGIHDQDRRYRSW